MFIFLGTDTQEIGEITEIPLDEANQNTEGLSKYDSGTGLVVIDKNDIKFFPFTSMK